MTQSPVVHTTFSIARTYPVPAARVFSAFATQATKRRWFAEGEGWQVDEFSLDFRVGGSERARFRFTGGGPSHGALMGNDTVYLDIEHDRRIVLAYTMTMGERRISASLATIELDSASDGTRLTFTEQAAFFEGADGPGQREGGWQALLARLGDELPTPDRR